MNLLPSSTSVTPASDSDTSAEKSPEICEGCGSRDSWITHSARFRCIIHFYCTHCLLRKHPTSFCPSCFAFYDSSPPHHSRRVSCSDCGSYTHIHCAADDANSNSTPYRCPPCRDPDSFSFFRPIVDANGVRCVDKSLSAAFLCAAKISASSMNKAVSLAKCEAERKGKDAAVARKRAREALDDVIKLDEKAKSYVELSANRDQKPSLSPDLAMQIQCLKPSSTGAEDSFIWHQTASGIYSTKSGYFAKMKTFLWSIVHKAISLGSNLHRRGMTSASLCVRCQDTENEMHCFFNCQYAKKVWDLVPLSKAVHLAAGMTFPEVVVKFRKVICLPPSGISLNILPWVLWAIWTARNTLIFEGRYQSPEETALRVSNSNREHHHRLISITTR